MEIKHREYYDHRAEYIEPRELELRGRIAENVDPGYLPGVAHQNDTGGDEVTRLSENDGKERNEKNRSDKQEWNVSEIALVIY